MTTRPARLGRILSYAVVGALFLLASNFLTAQTSGLSSGFTLEFLKTSEEASSAEVVSNVVRAKNRTSRPIKFSMDLSSPSGWRSIHSTDKVYSLDAGDSLFIPVRLIPSRNTSGDVSYFISATAYSEFGNALASAPWTLEIKKISKWNMEIVNREIFFPNEADSASVSIRLTNEGNAVEQLRVSFFADAKLQVLNEKWERIRDNTYLMDLPVGIDTTFNVNVRISNNRSKGYFFSDRPDDPNDDKSRKKFRLQVQAASTTKSSDIKGRRVDFVKLTNEVAFDNENGSSTIPLMVELNSYNVLSNFTNFTLDFRGEADLGRRRNLRYNYQGIITTSVINGTEFQGSNKFIQYSSPKTLLAAGNIGENMGVLINGVGAKGLYRLGNLEVGGIYVTGARRSGRLAANDLDFYAGRIGYRFNPQSRIQLQYVNRKDNFNSKDGQLYRMRFDYRLSKKHRIGFSAGYSLEQDSFNPDSVFQVAGYGGDFRYAGSFNKLNISISGVYNSESFITLRSGSRAANLNLRYTLGNRRYLTFRAALNEAQPVAFNRGLRFESDLRKFNSYEIQYEWKTQYGNFLLFPKYTEDEILGLRTNTKGAGVTYSMNRGRDFRLFSKFFTGFSEAPDFEIDPYLIAKWENRLRYKNLNVLARYNYGPASVAENLRVVNDRINPQSLFVSAYATLYFRKQGISVRPRINSSYESVLGRWRVNFAQDFAYYAKSGFIFTAGTELLMIKQGEGQLALINQQQGIDILNDFQQSNFFLRLGVKKEFSFRRPGSKNYNLTVAVFKDMDGNGVRDKGEDFIENALIRVNDKTAVTGKSGKVVFKNLTQGEYLVGSDVLSNTSGWFKVRDNRVFIQKDQTINIPLSRGVQINGNILLQRATYSAVNENMNLEGIRVTAVGADDRVYSAITDRAGSFRLYVPFGKYTIKASTTAIDERLQYAQEAYELDIDNADSNYQLTYYLIEKRRRLNIRKFNNN